MRVLPLCLLLFFIDGSYAICGYGFDRPIDRQFVDMVERHFTSYEMFIQREVQQVVDSFVREERGRKEVLRHLMDAGYLTIENSPNQNRLFSDILDKPPEEVIKIIKRNPESLYEGTLLDLPPFFLVVFVGEKEVMETSIKIDKNLVNSRNPLQDVPLHYTIDPDMATGLFFYNAKPNEPNKKGRVPLYNVRNPETVRVMLYYNSNPMVRDRSGVPLIRYHREQVGDQEIVSLLEEARDSRRSLKLVRNKEPQLIVPQKTEEEIRAEEAQRAEERRLAEEQMRAEEAQRAEERRLAEAARAARVAEAEEANRKEMEESKRELLSDLAEVMASAMITKAIVIRIINQTIDLKIFSNVETTLQSVRKRSSGIVIYDKEFEENFLKELEEAIKGAKVSGRSVEENERMYRDIMLDKTDDKEKELLAKLEEEIGHYSIGKIRGMLNRAERYYQKFNRMMDQVVKIKVAQDMFIRDVVAEIESRPGARAAIVRRNRGLVRSLPFNRVVVSQKEEIK